MQVRLVAFTKPLDPQILSPEDLLVYCARVSNPKNQLNSHTGAQLLRYCAEKGHWSVFETVSATVQIVTSRAISRQLLRHRSFTFQEFSQRYSEAPGFEPVGKARTQEKNNRQASFSFAEENAQLLWKNLVERVQEVCLNSYKKALDAGIAREMSRFLLPEITSSRLYMTGNLRSWVHFLQARLTPETQAEHAEVAGAVLEILRPVFPVTMGIFFPLPA